MNATTNDPTSTTPRFVIEMTGQSRYLVIDSHAGPCDDKVRHIVATEARARRRANALNAREAELAAQAEERAQAQARVQAARDDVTSPYGLYCAATKATETATRAERESDAVRDARNAIDYNIHAWDDASTELLANAQQAMRALAQAMRVHATATDSAAFEARMLLEHALYPKA